MVNDILAPWLPSQPPPTLLLSQLGQAAALMATWQLPALAVLDEASRVLGVVTQARPQDLQAAAVLSSSATLAEARAALQDAAALAVVDAQHHFAALLTSSDLALPAEAALAQRVWQALRPADQQLLTQLSKRVSSGQVALVGGAVRDALLGLTSQELTPLDLDMVVVGAAVESLVQNMGAAFVFHPTYQNATLTLPSLIATDDSASQRSADVVSARMERYTSAGASPQPHAGTLSQDLRRRDFSLNALALVMTANGPQLYDPMSGLADLAARVLRPLHAQSLTDDASRLIRGARLAARLDLVAAPELLAQVPQALSVADQTPRLDAELRLILSEPRPSKVAELLHIWGAGALLPDSLGVLTALDALQQRPSEAVYAAGLLSGAADPQVWAERLALGPRPLALLERSLSTEYVAAGSPEATLRGVLRPEAYIPLIGKDVMYLGVKAGPQIGAALAYLADLRNAGSVQSRDDELAALHAYLALKC